MGSTTHIVDEDGNVQNRYEYDAWGKIEVKEEAVPNRFTYYGQQIDPITQQYYLRARFYNPVIGRFAQEDTYRGDGLNLYAYCANNPVYYVDPSGYNCDKKDALRQQVISSLTSNGKFKNAEASFDRVMQELATRKVKNITDFYHEYKTQFGGNRTIPQSELESAWAYYKASNYQTLWASLVKTAPQAMTLSPSQLEKAIAEVTRLNLDAATRGPGRFAPETSAMSPEALEFQGPLKYILDWKSGVNPLNPDRGRGFVEFDGWDPATNQLIDRKLSTTTFTSARNEAIRQATIATQYGITVRWEVPLNRADQAKTHVKVLLKDTGFSENIIQVVGVES